MFKRTRFQTGSFRLKKRAKGEKCWELRYYEAGRRKHVTVGTVTEFPSLSAVRKSARVQAILLGANAESPMVSGEVSMAALIGRYEVEEMPERYSTGASYRSYFTCHIKPRWENTLIGDVKPMAVEAWLNRLALAPKTRHSIKQLMHVLFESAVRWELIAKNPIAHVRVKGGSKRLEQPRVLEVGEFQRLVSCIGEPYRTMILIAGCLGLRASEIGGLQWGDFDTKNGTVLVQRAVVHGRVGAVKTECSRSLMPVHPFLMDALTRHREHCYPTAEGWLFANPGTAKPYHQSQIVKTHIKKAAIAAGIKGRVGFHTFRHSYRTWLDQAGASMTVQKELMRHSSITTTMDIYGQAISTGKRQANSNVVEMVLREPFSSTPEQQIASGGLKGV